MASQQTFRCVVCYRNADGYIELALDWRNEPLSQLYICKRDYDRIHSENYGHNWHKIEQDNAAVNI